MFSLSLALLLANPDPVPLCSVDNRDGCRQPTVLEAIEIVTGWEDWRLELRRICKRESRCKLIGYHSRDAWAGASRYAGAVRRGLLRPDECPEAHAREPVWRWGTVSSFGQSGVAIGHLPVCLPPEAMAESTELAAEVAVATFRHYCSRGYCACWDRVRIWVGVGKWRGLPFWRRIRSYRRQCGDPPAWLQLGVFVDAIELSALAVRRGLVLVSLT